MPLPPDPAARARHHAALLHALLGEHGTINGVDARQTVREAAEDLDALADRRDESLGAEAHARQADAVRGVLRIVQPRHAADVLPFRPRTTAAMPLRLTHEMPHDVPGGAA